MNTKECFKCGEVKLLTEFYKHKGMSDGRLNKCKECAKADVRRHRRENDSVREYDRLRSKRPERKSAARIVSDRWRKENPAAYRAQTAVNNAVRDGRLKKGPCEICGDSEGHGHHADYSRPLDVTWLCPKHHHRHHQEK